MKHSFIFLLTCICCALAGSAQLLSQEELKEQKEYSSLEEALSEPEKVYKLDLEYRDGDEPQLFNKIARLYNLQALRITHTQIREVSSEICALQNLQELNLGSNDSLTSLSPEIGFLKHLNYLNVSYTSIKDLPETFFLMDSLHTLVMMGVSGLNFEKTFHSLGRLGNLNSINAGWNNLETLPEAIGSLKELKELDLNKNRISYLPETIGNLTNLETLILGDKSGNGNELKGLPESIVQLKNLRTLNLFSNKLSTLPPSLCNLKKLEKLYLPYNNVASIPDCIFSMPELKDLNLYGNPLAKAPDSLVNFSPGSTLYLGDNNLSEYEDLKLAYLLQRREYKLGAPTDSFVIEPPLPAIDTLIYTFYQGPVEFPHNYRAKVTRNKVTWYELKGKTVTAKKVMPITEQEFIRLAYTADRFFLKKNPAMEVMMFPMKIVQAAPTRYLNQGEGSKRRKWRRTVVNMAIPGRIS
jgi:Leucine-rich repeat (LRR) protein